MLKPLPALSVDEPTISMTFQVNNSPFAGKEGKFVTLRKIKEKLEKELIHNVALRVEQLDDPDKFKFLVVVNYIYQSYLRICVVKALKLQYRAHK